MTDYGAELETKWKWSLLLDDYFGLKLGESEFKRWTNELKRELGDNLTDDDLCNAIRHRSFSDKKMFGKPTLKDLRIWVCNWRGTNTQAPPESGDYMDYHRREMATVFSRIDSATTRHELWAAIFATDNLDWELKGRERAEEYARAKHPDLFTYPRSADVAVLLRDYGSKMRSAKQYWQAKEPTCRDGSMREPGEEG